MKKVTYVLLASAFLTSAATAMTTDTAGSADPKTCANFNGFYAGWLVGYGSGSGNTKSYITDGATGAVIGGVTQPSIDGWNTGVVIGYGKHMGSSKVYLGLDLNYTFDNEVGRSYGIKVQEKDSLELALRVGAVMANALPYIKAGILNAKVEGKYTNPDNNVHQYLNDRLNGWLVGGGVDFKVSQHVVCGLDYTYSSLPTKGKPYTFGPALVDTNNTKTQINDNKVRLKIAYQF